jgi:hypothetical protein
MASESDPKPESRAPGGEEDDEILSMKFGGKTIGENLEAAIAAGRVIRRADGKLSVPQTPPAVRFGNGKLFERDCGFLNQFMFEHIYGGACVPVGCATCYKVKVEPQTMRQLMAVKKISEGFDCSAKSVPEVDNSGNQSRYASYFYLTGLDQARAVYKEVRAKVDADAALGPSVKVIIKRGCTNYEHACGPSDRYTFDPRLKDVEGYFRALYRPPKPVPTPAKKYQDAAVLLQIARTAYRIGDNTYRDFTGGKEIFPPTICYDPNGPDEEGSSN